MQELPHKYAVTATGQAEGGVKLRTDGVAPLDSLPPAQFGGPGDHWSPETLLVAAVADCFVLTFRAIARASNLTWTSLNCEVEGTLDRVERISQFTAFKVKATLRLPPDTSEERARRILEKTEQACLVTNSLKAASQLSATVESVE